MKVISQSGIYKELKNKADLVNEKVPAEQLPSYVDDVMEFASVESLPNPGETGKIYIALNTNLTYRWGGSTYIQIPTKGDKGDPGIDAQYTPANQVYTEDMLQYGQYDVWNIGAFLVELIDKLKIAGIMKNLPPAPTPAATHHIEPTGDQFFITLNTNIPAGRMQYKFAGSAGWYESDSPAVFSASNEMEVSIITPFTVRDKGNGTTSSRSAEVTSTLV